VVPVIHGKEGVDGSSPSEGFHSMARHSAVFSFPERRIEPFSALRTTRIPDPLKRHVAK
jgi:hypothetical protein